MGLGVVREQWFDRAVRGLVTGAERKVLGSVVRGDRFRSDTPVTCWGFESLANEFKFVVNDRVFVHGRFLTRAELRAAGERPDPRGDPKAFGAFEVGSIEKPELEFFNCFLYDIHT